MNKKRFAKRAATALAVSTPLALLVRVLPPRVYTMDLQVDYLQARALRDGLSILTPLDQLAQRYLPALVAFPHPSPRPPWLVVLGLPLSFVPFEWLGILWLVLNLGLFAFVGRRLGISVVGSLALAAWPPVGWSLGIGQWEVVILTLLVLGWKAAEAECDLTAGLFLGLAASIKLYPALLVVPFLIRRRLKVVVVSAAVFIASQMLSLLVVGPAEFLRYWLEILPANTQLYVSDTVNSSPYGALLRIFGGSVPAVAMVGIVALSLVAIVALVRLPPEQAPFALLVGLPTVWGFYSALALPAILHLWRTSSNRKLLYLALSLAALSLNQSIPLILTLGAGRLASNPVVAGLGALQPLGWLLLLALSLRSPSMGDEQEQLDELSAPSPVVE